MREAQISVLRQSPFVHDPASDWHTADVQLAAGQLMWQPQASIYVGGPLHLTAKGQSAAGFTGGGPLSFWAPELPGHQAVRGTGVYVHGRQARLGWLSAALHLFTHVCCMKSGFFTSQLLLESAV